MTNRRDFLSHASLLGAGLLLPSLPERSNATGQPMAPAADQPTFEPVPEVGTVFNEAEWMEDTLSGRKMLRLTSKRQYNHQPTYHRGAGFSKDSRYFAYATYNLDADSAVVLADLTTGQSRILDRLPDAKEGQFTGNFVAMLPQADKIAAVVGPYLWVYDLKTYEKKELARLEPGYVYGSPSGLCNGTEVIVPVMKAYDPKVQKPEEVNGVAYWVVNVRTGAKRIPFTDPTSRNNHIITHPTNPDLVVIDRDWPPGYPKGGDGGKKTRTWLLNLKTQALVEVRPNDPNRFQIHSNFSHDGKHIYYHGLSGLGRQEGPVTGRRHYIGVADLKGRVVHEWNFPYFWYGHVGSHLREDVIIVDGLLTKDLVAKVYWRELDSQGKPRIEMLCRHDSDWHTGQFSHPHCLTSPDGKYVSFNRGSSPRSDVYLVQIS